MKQRQEQRLADACLRRAALGTGSEQRPRSEGGRGVEAVLKARKSGERKMSGSSSSFNLRAMATSTPTAAVSATAIMPCTDQPLRRKEPTLNISAPKGPALNAALLKSPFPSNPRHPRRQELLKKEAEAKAQGKPSVSQTRRLSFDADPMPPLSLGVSSRSGPTGRKPPELASHQPVVWQADTPHCQRCGKRFKLLRRRHHCRQCGYCVCNKCSPRKIELYNGKRGRGCLVCARDIVARPRPSNDGGSLNARNAGAAQITPLSTLRLTKA